MLVGMPRFPFGSDLDPSTLACLLPEKNLVTPGSIPCSKQWEPKFPKVTENN